MGGQAVRNVLVNIALGLFFIAALVALFQAVGMVALALFPTANPPAMLLGAFLVLCFSLALGLTFSIGYLVRETFR